MKKILIAIALGAWLCTPAWVWGANCISGDCQNGQGVIVFDDGNQYEGQFKNGMAEGKGTLTSSQGLKYVGEFKNNSFDGQGSLIAPDGSMYVGEFRLDVPHGVGTMTTPDGKVLDGNWVDGVYVGRVLDGDMSTLIGDEPGSLLDK